VEQGASASAEIDLRQQGVRRVEVLRVESHLPVETQVELNKTQAGGYALTVSLTSTPPLQKLEGHISVFTDHPSHPRLEVPAEGWVSAADPFALISDADVDNRLYPLLLYALYLEESLTPEDVVEQILGGHRDDRSVSLLLRAMTSENWHTRQRAMEVLGQLGNHRALEAIRKAITEDPDEDVRRAAAAALVNIAGADALPELELALQDNDNMVRSDAAGFLGELNDPRAIPWLLRAKSDEDDSVREAAERALDNMTVKTD
jgi:HEAT repeat protein